MAYNRVLDSNDMLVSKFKKFYDKNSKFSTPEYSTWLAPCVKYLELLKLCEACEFGRKKLCQAYNCFGLNLNFCDMGY